MTALGGLGPSADSAPGQAAHVLDEKVRPLDDRDTGRRDEAGDARQVSRRAADRAGTCEPQTIERHAGSGIQRRPVACGTKVEDR